MNVPFSSAAPARSASPSSSRPEVVAAPGQDAQRLVDVRRDRLRVDAAEPRVALGVDLGDLDLAAGQQPRDPARAGAPHRLDQDAHVRGLEPIEVQRALGVFDVPGIRVEALDLPAATASANERVRRLRAGVVADRLLEHGQDVRAGRGAARRLDLEAVVRPRVVRGRDHDAARGAPLDHLVRGHLRRDRVLRHRHRDVVREQDLGRGLGEELGREAAVVADDDALLPSSPRCGPTRRRPAAQRRTFSYV